MVREFLKDESGATSIEYGLIVSLIGLACIVALETLGVKLAATFTSIADHLAAAL